MSDRDPFAELQWLATLSYVLIGAGAILGIWSEPIARGVVRLLDRRKPCVTATTTSATTR